MHGIAPTQMHTFVDSQVRPVRVANGRVLLIDQRLLPDQVETFDATSLDDMCYAIREMVVRGAPAIGVAAALGLACEARRIADNSPTREEFLHQLDSARSKL